MKMFFIEEQDISSKQLLISEGFPKNDIAQVTSTIVLNREVAIHTMDPRFFALAPSHQDRSYENHNRKVININQYGNYLLS